MTRCLYKRNSDKNLSILHGPNLQYSQPILINIVYFEY